MFEIPEGLVSIPPVIVSPLAVETLISDPYHIAQRDLRRIHTVSQAGEGIRVAVIDTGVDAKHEDIAHAVVEAADVTSSRGNGRDPHGHGTHVISTIAGKRSGGAPRAKVCSIKALDESGVGQDSWIANAILAAIEWKAHVINMSLGSPYPSQRILAALTKAFQANIIVFAATGNESASNNSYPANFNDVCLAVAAVDKSHRRATFSNAGQGTDIADYGVNIVAARAGGGYVAMSGTSMATPNAAAMGANRLSYEQHYGLPTPTLKERYAKLPELCTDLSVNGRDRSTGWGMINAFAAFGQPPVNSPEPAPPATTPSPAPTPPATQDKLIGGIWQRTDGTIYATNSSNNILPLTQPSSK